MKTTVVEWTHAGGGGYIAPLHLHHSEDEAWCVIEGTLAFLVGDEKIVAGPGQGAIAPRGVEHTYWNPDEAPARYLLALGPQTKALVDALHAPDRPELPELFAAHDSEFLGWP